MFISDVNVTGAQLRHGGHEAEMMQPRFWRKKFEVIEEKGGFISELAILHHLAAVKRRRGLIHRRLYTSETGRRPGPTARGRFQKGVGQAMARVSSKPYLPNRSGEWATVERRHWSRS